MLGSNKCDRIRSLNAEAITGDHQRAFQCDRSTTDHIFCIRQILEKNGNMIKSASALDRLQERL